MAQVSPSGLRYEPAFPFLNRPVSMSKYGEKAIACIENGDPFWTWTAKVVSLTNADRNRLKVFMIAVEMDLSRFITRQSTFALQAYYGDPNNSTHTTINGNTINLGTVVF